MGRWNREIPAVLWEVPATLNGGCGSGPPCTLSPTLHLPQRKLSPWNWFGSLTGLEDDNSPGAPVCRQGVLPQLVTRVLLHQSCRCFMCGEAKCEAAAGQCLEELILGVCLACCCTEGFCELVLEQDFFERVCHGSFCTVVSSSTGATGRPHGNGGPCLMHPFPPLVVLVAAAPQGKLRRSLRKTAVFLPSRMRQSEDPQRQGGCPSNAFRRGLLLYRNCYKRTVLFRRI